VSCYGRPVSADVFPETMWMLVLAAADGGDTERAATAFRELCGIYRDAIARWMRLQNLTPEDAEDATHDFLTQWLQRDNPLQGFKRGERRFRDFLRVCLRRFLLDRQERHSAARRGGGVTHIELTDDARIVDSTETVPLIDLALACDTHERAVRRIAETWRADIQKAEVNRLLGISVGELENPGYETLARELGVATGTLKSWVFRLRSLYHECFRNFVRQQVDPALIDEEAIYLLHLVSRLPPAERTQFSRNPVG